MNIKNKHVPMITGRHYYCNKSYNANGISFTEGRSYKCIQYNCMLDDYGKYVPDAGKLDIFTMENHN